MTMKGMIRRSKNQRRFLFVERVVAMVRTPLLQDVEMLSANPETISTMLSIRESYEEPGSIASWQVTRRYLELWDVICQTYLPCLKKYRILVKNVNSYRATWLASHGLAFSLGTTNQSLSMLRYYTHSFHHGASMSWQDLLNP